MTVITWVLAADVSRARIFETRGLKLDLQQVEDLRNPAARVVQSKDQNVQDDNASERFARSIAEYLERSRTQHRFDRLRLAVDPRFLVLLREQLSHETRKLVYEENKEDAASDEARGAQRHLQRR